MAYPIGFQTRNTSTSTTHVPPDIECLTGDLIVVAMMLDTTSGSVTTPSGYNVHEETTSGGRLWVASKVAASDNEQVPSITGPSTRSTFNVVVVRDHDGIDVTASTTQGNTGNPTTHDMPTVTTTAVNDLLLYFDGISNGGIAHYAAPGIFSLVHQRGNSTDPSLGCAFSVEYNIGITKQRQMMAWSSQNGNLVTIAVKNSAGGKVPGYIGFSSTNPCAVVMAPLISNGGEGIFSAVQTSNTTFEQTIASGSWSGGVATLVSQADHGLDNGDIIDIQLATVTGYNVTGVVATVVNSTTFSYPLASNPGTYSGTAGRLRKYFMGVACKNTDITNSGGTHLDPDYPISRVGSGDASLTTMMERSISPALNLTGTYAFGGWTNLASSSAAAAQGNSLIGGVNIGLGEGEQYRVYKVGSTDADDSVAAGQAFVIRSGGYAEYESTKGTPDFSALTKLYFPNSSSSINPKTCMLCLIGEMSLAGGSSNFPFGADDLEACGISYLFPVIQRRGNAFFPLCPIRVGGIEPIYTDLSRVSINWQDAATVGGTSRLAHVDDGWFTWAVDTIFAADYYNPPPLLASQTLWTYSWASTCHASATYIDSPVAVIGAIVDIQQTFRPTKNHTFTRCAQIDMSGLEFIDCAVINPRSGVGCNIDTNSVLTNINFSTSTSADYAIEITAAGTYGLNGCMFDGFTHDIDVTATTGTVTINISGGGDTPTYTSAGATVVINSGATFTITDLISGSVVYLRKTSDNSVIGYTNNSGTSFGISYVLSGDPSAYYTISKPSYKYIRRNVTLLSSDFSQPALQQADLPYSNP